MFDHVSRLAVFSASPAARAEWCSQVETNARAPVLRVCNPRLALAPRTRFWTEKEGVQGNGLVCVCVCVCTHTHTPIHNKSPTCSNF